MSILKKPYQLSIWQREWSVQGAQEKRIAIIGSDTMWTQNKAFNPKLVRNVNGTVTFTFSMYGKYIDNISGDEVINPFIYYLHNESLLKLKYDDKWYDLIVKSVSENSTNNTYEFSASDLHINELSKNGFNLQINQDLNNNYGSVTELGELILKDTDWTVDTENSHCSVQTIDEGLVRLVIPKETQIDAIQIFDPDPNNPQGVGKSESMKIPSSISDKPTIIYAFYSSCKNKPRRFQFIYIDNEDNYQYDDNHIITNSDCQYYMECFQNEYAKDSTNSYRFVIPEILDFPTDGEIISSDKRGRRYVFGEKTSYNNLLQRNLTRYYDNNKEEECWCSTDVEYITPVTVANLSGNTDFKSTNGWTASYIQIGELDEGWLGFWKKKPKDGLVEAMIMKDVVDSVTSDKKFPENITPYLKFTPVTADEGSVNAVPVLVGSGPSDNKDTIKNLIPGEEYVIMCKPKKGEDIPDDLEIEIAYYKESKDGLYDGMVDENSEVYLTFTNNGWRQHPGTKDSKVFLPSFKVEEGGNTTNKFDVYSGYYYQIVQVPSEYSLTESEYKARNVQMFIKGVHYGDSFAFEDLQFFKAEYCDFNFGSEDAPEIVNTIITPKSGMVDTVIKNVYKFYTDDVLENAKIADDIAPYFTAEYDFPEGRFKTVYYENAAKIRSIEAKESNYFNVLQSLCENFETWVDFNIDRNDDGSINSKKVMFKNYVGVQNYAGFKYGVNLQSISRKIDSANIVTKMIVKNNSNQAANNGYCSIARAVSNETGENCIYNFSYYINQKIINEEQLIKTLYSTAGAKGEDWDKAEYDKDSHKITNCNGYYTRLKLLNAELDKEIELNNNYYFPLNQAQSNLTVAEAGMKSAEEQKKDALANFAVVAGFDLLKTESISDEQAKLIEDSDDLQNYIYTYTEGEVQYKAFQTKFNSAQAAIDKYSELYENSNDRIDELVEQKNALHKAFQKLYGLYIQEGTWQEEKYYDDELYYVDALSTMRNSCFPQVQYTIQVVEISQIPGYEYYKFGLGDKTFIEDTEFFGYNSNGDPYREEIVLSEITEMLDDPSKNTITVKNYKTQFQDLFQRITASVQQTQFAQGSYAKAADLAEGSTKVKSSFLQEAMQDPALVLQNAGEQTVTWGADGIVIKDVLEPSEQVRLIGGAILIKSKDENGIGTWKTAITSKGISADLITAGKINTGEIQIMNGDQPTFRWDSLGITAYDFNTINQGDIGKVNFSKGVRFDKFGVYGYNSEGTNFVPVKENIHTSEDLLKNSKVTFGLTWDGLKMSSGNGSAGILTNNYYNTFTDDYGQEQTYGAVRFYAGTNSLFGQDNHALDANFIVTEKGYMKATYGEIGPWNMNSSGLWYGSYSNPTAAFFLSGNTSFVMASYGNFSEVNTDNIYGVFAGIAGIYSGYIDTDTINTYGLYIKDTDYQIYSNGDINANIIDASGFRINNSGFQIYSNGNIDMNCGSFTSLFVSQDMNVDGDITTDDIITRSLAGREAELNISAQYINLDSENINLNTSGNINLNTDGNMSAATLNDKRILTEEDLSNGFVYTGNNLGKIINPIVGDNVFSYQFNIGSQIIYENSSWPSVIHSYSIEYNHDQNQYYIRTDGGQTVDISKIEYLENNGEQCLVFYDRANRDFMTHIQYPASWYYNKSLSYDVNKTSRFYIVQFNKAFFGE